MIEALEQARKAQNTANNAIDMAERDIQGAEQDLLMVSGLGSRIGPSSGVWGLSQDLLMVSDLGSRIGPSSGVWGLSQDLLMDLGSRRTIVWGLGSQSGTWSSGLSQDLLMVSGGPQVSVRTMVCGLGSQV